MENNPTREKLSNKSSMKRKLGEGRRKE